VGIFDKITDALTSGKEGELTQNEDEKDLVAWVKNRVEEARQNPARVAFESQVVTNTAYVLGFDNIYYDSRARAFRSQAGFPGGPQSTKARVNLILPTIQNRLSRLCKNPPRYDVPPNSMSQEDKDAARLALKALNNKFDDERVNEKRIENAMWMQQAGFSWVKVCWDPTKGKKIPTPDGGIEFEGDVSIDTVSPLEVFVDPQAKNRDEVTWLIHAKVRKLNYFRDQYPEKGHLVKEEGPWLLSAQKLAQIQQMNQKGAAAQGPEQMKNSAVELAYYEKPSRKYSRGRFIVVANGVLLEYKDLPIDEIPFAKFDDVKIAGKFYSESIITSLRPLQDQMNRNMRRKAEFLNKGLTLKFLAPKGSGLNEESLNDSTEVVEFNAVPGAPAVQPVQSPQLPQYVYTDSESFRSYFAEISGISEPSKGQMPSASIPAVGMQILQEADETRIGIVTESNENSWADVGRFVLKYMDAYYDTPRYIKEAGANGEYSIQEFTSRDLRGHTEVRVIKGSTLPNSKVLKRQELLNLFSQGLLGDPADPAVRRKLLQQLEFGDLAGVWEDQMVDDAQVKRTIEQIEQGLVPEVHPDDNHQVHFETKNRVRKTEKFLNYPPEVQQIFLADLEAHKMYLQPPAPMMPPAPGAAPPELPVEEPPPLTEEQVLAEQELLQ